MVWFSQEVRPGVWVGFTDASTGNLARHVGDDPARVAAVRSRLEGELAGLTGAPVHLQYMNQVHGNAVAIIDGAAGCVGDGTAEGDAAAPGATGPGAAGLGAAGPTADAMVTRSGSLAVMVADCVPVVFAGTADDGGPVLGVAHAGRPGVEKGVIAATAAALRDAGARELHAWIGPSVCGRCYEVPADMRESVSTVAPAARSTTSWGTPALDLPAAVAAQLADAGIPATSVAVCTLEDAGFFSHRRAVRDGTAEGRFIGFAVHSGSPEHR